MKGLAGWTVAAGLTLLLQVVATQAADPVPKPKFGGPSIKFWDPCRFVECPAQDDAIGGTGDRKQ